MTPFDSFSLQLDRIKRDLRTPYQTFHKRAQANPRNVFTVPVEFAEQEPGAYWHGTAYGYKGKGCRCAPCTRANADIQLRYKQKRRYFSSHVPQPALFQSVEGR